MNNLFTWFDYASVFDDILVITKASFEEHLNHLDTILEKIGKAGLKIHAIKLCFAAHKLEYLSYWISRDGIQPLASKVIYKG